MQQKFHGLTIVFAALLAASCSPRDGGARRAAAEQPVAAAASPAVPTRPAREPVRQLTPEEWTNLLAQVRPLADSADHKLRFIPNLTSKERGMLRKDVNDLQIERARMLGVRAVGGPASLVQQGRLVPLSLDTALWVVRDLKYSEPYVTPAAHVMLVELGTRFQAALDTLGIPRYRLDITSVLRTPEAQAELRRRNRNASRKESAHEFGTTVDVAYRRYAAPVAQPDLTPELQLAQDSALVETARMRATEVQAILGRVLLQMQHEGKLMVIMERAQPVYHMTVARPLAPPRRPAAAGRTSRNAT